MCAHICVHVNIYIYMYTYIHTRIYGPRHSVLGQVVGAAGGADEQRADVVAAHLQAELLQQLLRLGAEYYVRLCYIMLYDSIV